MTGPRWPRVALGEVLRLTWRGETPTFGRSYRLAGVSLWGRGVYIRETIDGSATSYPQLFRIEEGDIVVNKIWARNGSVSVAGPEVMGSYGSPEFPTYAPDRKLLDPRWAYWFTRWPDCWRQCDDLSRGTSGQNRLRPERFLDVAIPLPPLPDQRRIVARLDAAAERVERLALMRDEISTEVEALVISAHLAGSRGREVELDEVLHLDEEREAVVPGRTYPQIGIKGFGEGLFKKPSVASEDTTYRHFNRLFAGAFVVSQVKGWEGAVAVCGPPMEGAFVSPEYRTFRCDPNGLRPTYLAHLCRTSWFHEHLAKLSRGQGARRERLRPESLTALRLPLPSIREQARLEAAFERAADVQRLLATDALAALLPALLHRAFGDAAEPVTDLTETVAAG